MRSLLSHLGLASRQLSRRALLASTPRFSGVTRRCESADRLRRFLTPSLASACIALLLSLPLPRAKADSIVGCTDSLEAALNAGGRVLLSCNTTNFLAHTITITNNVVLDGAN